jgi:hypothetical protein
MTNEANHPEELSELRVEDKRREISSGSDDAKMMRSKPSIHLSKKKGKEKSVLYLILRSHLFYTDEPSLP